VCAMRDLGFRGEHKDIATFTTSFHRPRPAWKW
jgi:hypothetical protein